MPEVVRFTVNDSGSTNEQYGQDAKSPRCLGRKAGGPSGVPI